MADSHTELNWWLDVATRGLCEDARKRIGEEIASHYEDALSEARAEGLADDAVIARAVRSLGNPRHARRRLRREHLTLREAASLSAFAKKREERIRKRGDKNANEYSLSSLYIGISAMLLGVIFLVTSIYKDDGLRMYVAATCMFLYGLQPIGQYGLGRWVSRRLYPDGRVPAWRTVQLRGIGTLPEVWGVLCLYGITTSLLTSSHLWFFEICYGVLAISSLAATLIQLRFARKLQRLGFDDPPTAYG